MNGHRFAGVPGASATSGHVVTGHPEHGNAPFMTVGMRIQSFKLAWPAVIISPDHKSLWWRNAEGREVRKDFDSASDMIDYAERTFGGR